MRTQYDTIYLNQSRLAGQVRMSESGLGWKVTEKQAGGSAQNTPDPFLLPAKELLGGQWSRGARGWLLRLQTRSQGVINFDGFRQDDLDDLRTLLTDTLNTSLEHVAHSMRGWTWGATKFERNELVFNIANYPAFEIPYSSVANSNIVGKADVTLDLSAQLSEERTSAGDELVEIRFHVPGVMDAEEGGEDGEEVKQEQIQEEAAVQVFHKELTERAEIGSTGTQLAAFADVLLLTPRGRYDCDFFEDSFRLRGKSYDYKIRYASLQRIFVLPRTDDLHNLVVLQLDPPLQQGQTRYPFVVMQFEREAISETEINCSPEQFQDKFEGRLERKYSDKLYTVVAQLFKGLSNRKLIFPGSFVSTNGMPAVTSSLKTLEGSLYLLERAFLFVSRSPVYIPYAEVSAVRFSRLSSSGSASNTFDITVKLKASSNQHEFGNVDRQEQPGLETFLRTKGINCKNDIVEEPTILDEVLEVQDTKMADAALLDADDDESDDEDFADEGVSDVDEEFDSNAESSDGSGSEMSESEDEADRKRRKTK